MARAGRGAARSVVILLAAAWSLTAAAPAAAQFVKSGPLLYETADGTSVIVVLPGGGGVSGLFLASFRSRRPGGTVDPGTLPPGTRSAYLVYDPSSAVYSAVMLSNSLEYRIAGSFLLRVGRMSAAVVRGISVPYVSVAVEEPRPSMVALAGLQQLFMVSGPDSVRAFHPSAPRHAPRSLSRSDWMTYTVSLDQNLLVGGTSQPSGGSIGGTTPAFVGCGPPPPPDRYLVLNATRGRIHVLDLAESRLASFPDGCETGGG